MNERNRCPVQGLSLDVPKGRTEQNSLFYSVNLKGTEL
jgi:hypothetical protein